MACIRRRKIMKPNKSWRTNRPSAFQSHFNIPSTAPVGAHQTFAETMNLDVMCRFLFVVASCLVVGCDRRPQDSSRNGNRGEHPTAINSDVELHDDSEESERIPKTLDEAVDLLMEGLTDEDRKIINNLGDDYAALVHRGAGMGMRNSWGLWGDSPLKRYFIRLGIFHADNMSGIISVAFSRRVRGKPIELNQLVQNCRDSWEKEDIIAPLDLICPHCHKEMPTDYAGAGHSKGYPDRVYFYGRCPSGHNFYFYHKDGWLEGWPEYGEQDGADGLLDLASSHEEVGDYTAALTDYEKALKLNPKSERAANNLAWFLATTPAPALRNGKRSLALAQDAVKIAGQPEPDILDTLAASYAATGDFKSAVAILEQAISLTSDDSLRSKLSSRLGLYEASTPYISPPASAPKGEQAVTPNDR
jgi:tetratricopeptide (TPR) repeat protein